MGSCVEIDRAVIRGLGDSNSPYVLLPKAIRWKFENPDKGTRMLFVQDAKTAQLTICLGSHVDTVSRSQVVIDRTKVIHMGSGSPYILIPQAARRKLDADPGDEFIFLEDAKTGAIIVRIDKASPKHKTTTNSAATAKRAS